MKKIRNIKLNKKIFIIGIFVFSLVFYGGFYLIAKASSMRVFAGEVVWVMPDCSEPTTCSARCPICGCGLWQQIQIAPTFGRVPQSTDFICPAYVFQPNGNANFMVGSVIFGYGATDKVIVNNTPAAQIWSVFQ